MDHAAIEPRALQPQITPITQMDITWRRSANDHTCDPGHGRCRPRTRPAVKTKQARGRVRTRRTLDSLPSLFCLHAAASPPACPARCWSPQR